MLVILIEASVLSSVICAQDSDVYEGNPQEFSSGFLYDENKKITVRGDANVSSDVGDGYLDNYNREDGRTFNHDYSLSNYGNHILGTFVIKSKAELSDDHGNLLASSSAHFTGGYSVDATFNTLSFAMGSIAAFHASAVIGYYGESDAKIENYTTGEPFKIIVPFSVLDDGNITVVKSYLKLFAPVQRCGSFGTCQSRTHANWQIVDAISNTVVPDLSWNSDRLYFNERDSNNNNPWQVDTYDGGNGYTHPITTGDYKFIIEYTIDSSAQAAGPGSVIFQPSGNVVVHLTYGS